jgi:hypothetical protein
MSLSFRRAAGVTLSLIVATTLAEAPRVRGEDKPPPTRREFMRQKLEYSKRVIEGLTVENFETVSRSARAQRLLSQAAEWEVPTIPNATEYVTFTGEFQRLCDELGARAKEKNIDGATLTYLRLTMNCVNCHKYIRVATR